MRNLVIFALLFFVIVPIFWYIFHKTFKKVVLPPEQKDAPPSPPSHREQLIKLRAEYEAKMIQLTDVVEIEELKKRMNEVNEKIAAALSSGK